MQTLSVDVHTRNWNINMNQIVTDVISIDLFTIERSTLEPSTWLVYGHGDDDSVQIFDSYDTLSQAEKAYPDAVTVLHNS